MAQMPSSCLKLVLFFLNQVVISQDVLHLQPDQSLYHLANMAGQEYWPLLLAVFPVSSLPYWETPGKFKDLLGVCIYPMKILICQ